MKLAELQQVISRALINDGSTEALSSLINSHPSLTVANRLAIYRDSKLTSLQHAMALTYPVCQQLVGVPFFMAMVEQYINATPSYSPNLDDYGASFADFIAQFTPAERLPYLADVAQLEWSWLTAWHGPAVTTSLNFQALAQVDAEQALRLQFKLPANAVLLASDYPVDNIWQVNQASYCGEQSVNIHHDPVKLIIWRPNNAVYIERVSDAEWYLLQAVNNGLHLEEIVRRTAAADDTIDIEQHLPRVAAKGWLAEFSLK